MARLVQLATFAVLSALLGGAVAFHRAPDLSALVPPAAAEGDTPADLAELISQVVIKQAGKQSIDELTINRFLTSTLAARQDGITSGWAMPHHVLCDLQEKSARIHLTWKVGPHEVHAAVDLSVSRQGADLVFDITGGQYGSLRVPRALLFPIKPALERLAEACQPEIDALLTLPRLSIAKEKLVLDPTF